VLEVPYYKLNNYKFIKKMDTKKLDEKSLKIMVDKIISISNDDEAAHSEEDDLHLVIIEQFCPEWVKKQVNRLSESDFCRWCA